MPDSDSNITKSYKIIHMPAYRDGYQRLLLANLRAVGLDVKFAKSKTILSILNYSLLYNLNRNLKVDVIHLHWQHPFLIDNSRFGTVFKSIFFICQLLLLKILGKKVVWTVHNLVNHEKKHRKLELFFCGIIARIADAIIAHCEMAKKAIQKEFSVKKKNKITVIPHGAFFNIFKNTMSRAEARNRLNLSQKDITFLFLGQLFPYKGVLELIECFLALHCLNAKLIIAGKVPNKKFAELISKNAEKSCNIRLVFGRVNNDDMQLYMNAADFMVLPYRNILTSGSVITGMSFGKAIIASRLGCIPEILDSAGGFVYNLEEEQGLLNAMKQATKVSRAKILEMGNYNLEMAKKLNWRDIALSTCKVYEMCLGRLK